MPQTDSKQKYIDIQKQALIGRLEGLLSRLDNPAITMEQLDEVRALVAECQQRMEELKNLTVPAES